MSYVDIEEVELGSVVKTRYSKFSYAVIAHRNNKVKTIRLPDIHPVYFEPTRPVVLL